MAVQIELFAAPADAADPTDERFDAARHVRDDPAAVTTHRGDLGDRIRCVGWIAAADADEPALGAWLAESGVLVGAGFDPLGVGHVPAASVAELAKLIPLKDDDPAEQTWDHVLSSAFLAAAAAGWALWWRTSYDSADKDPDWASGSSA